MPGKSGFDVLEWLKSEELKQIPVIVFTSSIHQEDRVRALELGAREYLVKPVGFEALQQLATVLDDVLASNGSLDGPCFQRVAVQLRAAG